MRKDGVLEAALIPALALGAWLEVTHHAALEAAGRPRFVAPATLGPREYTPADHAPETLAEEIEFPLLGVLGSSGSIAAFNHADFSVLPPFRCENTWTVVLHRK